MTALDRASPVPLWAQLEALLRRRLASGEFEGGFPTEAKLTSEFGVSRQTVRQAIARLENDGLLERRRGRGTTVAKAELEQPLRSLYSLARSIEAGGLEERSDVLTAEMRSNEEAAAALGLGAGVELVFIERLRFAGGEPLAIDRSWLPADIARPLLQVDLTRGSLYAALADVCDVRVTGGSERIRPVLPPRDDRTRLRLPQGEAALFVQRLALAGNDAVELRLSTIRGDRYSFVAEWSGADAGFHAPGVA